MSLSAPTLPDAAADLARNGDATGLGALLKDGLAGEAPEPKGNTQLRPAGLHGRAQGVKLLLKSGAPGAPRNQKGQNTH